MCLLYSKSMRMPSSNRFGPLWLAPGVTRFNVMTNFYASFVTIGMLTGMSFLSGYILTEHLHIPVAEQGGLTGDLGFWSDVVIGSVQIILLLAAVMIRLVAPGKEQSDGWLFECYGRDI